MTDYESKLKLLSSVKAARVPVLTHAYWAIMEVLLDQKTILLGALSASFRGNEPAENRERIIAQICTIENLESAFRGY